MQYGIVENGQARAASPRQIEAWVAAAKGDGRSYAYSAIVSWPADELAAMSIYPIRSEYTAPGPYQYQAGETYTLEGAEIVRRTVIADFTLEQAKAKATADMAAKRYEVETGGMTVNGMAVSTDRDSQGLVLGAAFAANLDPAYVVKWKTADGFVDLDAATVIALAQAIRAHVQAAFDREAEVVALIDAATTVDEVKAIEW